MRRACSRVCCHPRRPKPGTWQPGSIAVDCAEAKPAATAESLLQRRRIRRISVEVAHGKLDGDAVGGGFGPDGVPQLIGTGGGLAVTVAAGPSVQHEELKGPVASANADEIAGGPAKNARSAKLIGEGLQTAHRLDATP